MSDHNSWEITKRGVVIVLAAITFFAIFFAILSLIAQETSVTADFNVTTMGIIAQTLGSIAGGGAAALAAFYIADNELRRRRADDQKKWDITIKSACAAVPGTTLSIETWILQLINGAAAYDTLYWQEPAVRWNTAYIDELIDVELVDSVIEVDALVFRNWKALKKQAGFIEELLQEHRQLRANPTFPLSQQLTLTNVQANLIFAGSKLSKLLSVFLSQLEPAITINGGAQRFKDNADRLLKAFVSSPPATTN